MNDVKIFVKRLKNATIDTAAMINNSVLFVLAWIVVYIVFQFFTILPAFTMGVRMVIYNGFIDFNSVNTAASDKNLWSSADNIYNVFLTPVIFTVILALVAVLFLIKWNSDRLNMRRFLFWIILCSIIRICGNYIFGQLFDLWNWNLVTDFMGITYPSMILKYAMIVVIAFIASRLFVAMSHEIKKLFNPYISDRFSNLVSNIFLPTVLGCIFLTLWNLPLMPINEIGNIVFMLLFIVFFMCRPFMYLYRGIEQERLEEDYKESVNIVPIIILALLTVGDVLLMNGLLLENSAYRYFFIENAIMVFIVIVLLVTLFISLRVSKRRANVRKMAFRRRVAEIESIHSIPRHSVKGQEQQTKVDLDKYKNAFVKQEDEEEEVPKIDLENAEKYGFKRYNLSKYSKRYW